MPDQHVPAGDEPRIDATFRNGSVTAVGIILGFSLGFLSQWASNPIAWSVVDIAAAAPIITCPLPTLSSSRSTSGDFSCARESVADTPAYGEMLARPAIMMN